MRALILGGTRFLGRQVMEMLHASGWDVTVFSRSRSHLSLPPGVRSILGDRRDPQSLRYAAESGPYDVVMDSLAFDQDDVRMLGDALGEMMGTYVLTSTAWVYLACPPRPDQAYQERDLLPGSSSGDAFLASLPAGLPQLTRQYVHGKFQAESMAFERIERVIALRPCMAAGPFDHLQRIEFYAQRVRVGSPAILIDGGTRRFPLLYVRDFARAVVALLQTPTQARAVVNIAPEESTSSAEIWSMVENALDAFVPKCTLRREQLATKYPSYLEYEPFALPIEGRYDPSVLKGLIQNFRFTTYSDWIAQSAHAAAAVPLTEMASEQMHQERLVCEACA